MSSRLLRLRSLLLFPLVLANIACSHQKTVDASGQLSPEQAVSIATEAYIYGYPLVTMDMTRQQITNVAVPVGSRGPMDQLIKRRNYPAADDHAVTAPNADTLYTQVWLDVSREPWVFTIPDMGDR